MYSVLSEASHKMASAISEVLANLPIGICDKSFSPMSLFSATTVSSMGDFVYEGQTQFILIFLCAYSRAADFVIPTTANLLAV